jgi:endonuclease/exonuclease/phosphatase (EEP) superfamily protein YafD
MQFTNVFFKYLYNLITSLIVVAANLSAIAMLLYILLRSVWRGHVWFIDLAANFMPFYFIPIAILLVLAYVLLRRTLPIHSTIPLILVPLVVCIIGALWFSPYFLPKSQLQTSASGLSLKVITYNVDIDNNHDDQVLRWLRDSQADFVLLQEIPLRWQADAVREQLGESYPYSVIQETYPRGGAGNAVLSRLPIIEQTTFKLTTADRFYQQRLVLNTSMGQIAAYNVHLMPNYGDFPRLRLPGDNPWLNIALSYQESIRSLQITQLLEMLHEETLPFIIGGDFNTSEYSILYGALAASLHDTFREVGNGFGFTWPSSDTAKLPMLIPSLIRIDYIWHSDHFQSKSAWLGSPLGSDHYPVFSEILFTGS